MKKIEIKPGDTYGRLTVIREVKPHICPSGQKARKVLCECSCENKTRVEVQLNSLRGGATTSCGCFQKEKAKENATIHGLTNHPLFKVWEGMKCRCSNKKRKDYGGRGIRVCVEWLEEFQAFYNFAMANGWKKGLDIDRINNDGNYNPTNCRFVYRSENNLNKRIMGKIPYRGVYFNKCAKKYYAQVRIKGKLKHIGCYNTVIEAAKAYDQFVINNKLPNKLNFKGENNE